MASMLKHKRSPISVFNDHVSELLSMAGFNVAKQSPSITGSSTDATDVSVW